MTAQLSVEALRKTYVKGQTQVPVLAGVDLEVERGEMVAILGASGSGKSTLLHLVGLLDRPDAGEILLEGERIDHQGNRHRDRLRNQVFGFVFQFYHLLPELDAIENVMLPALIRHSPWGYWRHRSRIRSEARDLLERVGLGHRRAHRPGELSGGEMQRATIARALAAKPEILLADEPTGNLDAETGVAIFELLRDLNREQGLTMLVVTHDQSLATRADRAVTLQDGHLKPWQAYDSLRPARSSVQPNRSPSQGLLPWTESLREPSKIHAFAPLAPDESYGPACLDQRSAV